MHGPKRGPCIVGYGCGKFQGLNGHRAHAESDGHRPAVHRGSERANRRAVCSQARWYWFRDEETAQGLVEYALIIVVVSLGTIAALTFLRGTIRGLFSSAGSSIQNGAK